MIHFYILIFCFLSFSLHALELSRETVILELRDNARIHVTVSFYMKGKLTAPLGMAFPETNAFPLENFQVQWNAKELKVSKKMAGKHKQFQIGNLSLPAIYKFSVPASKGNNHSLLTTYNYIAPSSSGTKSPGGLYAEYILQTGATWDHDIDEVIFILRGKGVDCKKILVFSNSYEGGCNEKGEYLVKLEYIEPEKDFRYLIME